MRATGSFSDTTALLIVRLQNQANVAQPLDVGSDELRAVAVLIVALREDKIRENILRPKAPHSEAPDKLAGSSGLSKGIVAVVAQLCGELVSTSDAFLGCETII